MLPVIQDMALEGVTVECRESTQKSHTPYPDIYTKEYGWEPLNRLRFPGQFEMICYQVSDNSYFLDSEGKFNWTDIHEENTVYSNSLYGSWENAEKYKNTGFMTMETSFNLTKFELWILSDRCNPNHHCFRSEGGLMESYNILRVGSRFSTHLRIWIEH